MITEKQLEFLRVFLPNIFREITFSDIKKETKESSNNKLQKALIVLIKENIIKVRKIGKTNLYSLNIENNRTFTYLALIEYEIKSKPILLNALYDVQHAVMKKTCLFSLVIFGSYAKEKATKKSDLDIAIFIENEKIRKNIIPYIETMKRKHVIEIDYHIITEKEFFKMLKMDEENIGKDIFRNYIVFYNPVCFYELLKKGWKNGFKN
ncbi:MAG: nucleotidyltransferase domain-containing protein [Candidatus Aenigmatarchaeota archaeon]